MTGNCGLPDGFVHAHQERCYEAGRREALERAEAAEATVERVRALIDAWESAHTHLGIERHHWGPSSSSLHAALDGDR